MPNRPQSFHSRSKTALSSAGSRQACLEPTPVYARITSLDDLAFGNNRSGEIILRRTAEGHLFVIRDSMELQGKGSRDSNAGATADAKGCGSGGMKKKGSTRFREGKRSSSSVTAMAAAGSDGTWGKEGEDAGSMQDIWVELGEEFEA